MTRVASREKHAFTARTEWREQTGLWRYSSFVVISVVGVCFGELSCGSMEILDTTVCGALRIEGRS